MKAQKCRLCGHEHHTWEPHAEFDKSDTKHSMRSFSAPTPNSSRASRGVTPLRNKLPEFVTKERNTIMKERNVTPQRNTEQREVPRSEPASKLKAALTEIDALHGEVAQLKRALAEARGGAPKPEPVPAAERMRKMRAKKRPFGEQQFEG